MANPARRRTKWDIQNSTRQAVRGGRGTLEKWSARGVRSSRSRFGLSVSGSIENGVSATVRGCDRVKIRIGERFRKATVSSRALRPDRSDEVPHRPAQSDTATGFVPFPVNLTMPDHLIHPEVGT